MGTDYSISSEKSSQTDVHKGYIHRIGPKNSQPFYNDERLSKIVFICCYVAKIKKYSSKAPVIHLHHQCENVFVHTFIVLHYSHDNNILQTGAVYIFSSYMHRGSRE